MTESLKESMTESLKAHLLTAVDMARFVTDGFLLLEGIVPEDLNAKVLEDAKQYKSQKGQEQNEFWLKSEALRKVFVLPKVAGAIQSFVGPQWHYHHSFLHIVPAKTLKSQIFHIDMGEMFPDPKEFDVQPFYFLHDTPLEMGPTLVLPGSHMRRACSVSISRYTNIVGQRHLVAKAGSIAFLHSNIWHCAQPNYTDTTRYVFKMRACPKIKQVRLFNTEGYNSEEVFSILSKEFRWAGDDGSKDRFQKMYFWRQLTGDETIPIDLQREIRQI